MTPFGEYLRKIRQQRGISQKEMATAVGVSAAYLSALENGMRGKPSFALVQRLVGYLNVIWDEAEKLQQIAKLSDPKVMVDTSKLTAKATMTSNLLAGQIADMEEAELDQLIELLNGMRKTSEN